MQRMDAAGCDAQVAGDSGDYVVSCVNGRWSCTCPHGAASRSLCSHALAAQAVYRSVLPALLSKS